MFAKEGATKKNIIDKFKLSRSMIRRLTAESIDKDLLRYHEPISSFMTSAKGINYLRKLTRKIRIQIYSKLVILTERT